MWKIDPTITPDITTITATTSKTTTVVVKARPYLLSNFASTPSKPQSPFNGVPLPALALWDSRTDDLSLAREFSYADFESRLS